MNQHGGISIRVQAVGPDGREPGTQRIDLPAGVDPELGFEIRHGEPGSSIAAVRQSEDSPWLSCSVTYEPDDAA